MSLTVIYFDRFVIGCEQFLDGFGWYLGGFQRLCPGFGWLEDEISVDLDGSAHAFLELVKLLLIAEISAPLGFLVLFVDLL